MTAHEFQNWRLHFRSIDNDLHKMTTGCDPNLLLERLLCLCGFTCLPRPAAIYFLFGIRLTKTGLTLIK